MTSQFYSVLKCWLFFQFLRIPGNMFSITLTNVVPKSLQVPLKCTKDGYPSCVFR